MYPGTEHGYVFPLRAGSYHKAPAERHWERLLAVAAGLIFCVVLSLPQTRKPNPIRD
jgi:dienelactone hydrolase